MKNRILHSYQASTSVTLFTDKIVLVGLNKESIVRT